MEFYALTPRQYKLLEKRHRETLAHQEMVGAFTTAAVVNNGMCRPDKPVSALLFMPSHRKHEAGPPPLTDEQLLQRDIYMGKVYELAARLRKQHYGE